jgi:fumarate reductase flavoprotein subunit
MPSRNMNRRELVKSVALCASTGLLAGVGGQNAVAAEDAAEDVDLLIVGAGNAGMPAAIQAADLGARVLLIDKNSFTGGMLNISGGHVSAANSKLQIRKGIEDSPEAHYRDAIRMGKYANNSELLKVAVENAGAMVDWLQEVGVEFTPESPFFEDDHDHYSAKRTYMGPEYARSLLHPLRAELDARIARGNIELRLNTRVTRLITNDRDEVTGVVAVDGSGESISLAAKAVLLTTGGYGASAPLKEQYNPKYAASKVVCMPHATGDGIVMAAELGAKLTSMDFLLSHPGAVDGGFGRLDHAPRFLTEGIWINKQGKRFANEHGTPDHREIAFLEQADFGFYYVFDQGVIDRGKLGMIGWESDQLDDHVKGGVVQKAGSVSKLAQKIGISGKQLSATLTAFNGSVSAGSDADFGRQQLEWPLENGPFYAVPITGSILITHGGISVNHMLQVVDENKRTISGLYAAGETLGVGQMMGKAVLSGMSVGPAITLGRIAARNAFQYAQSRQNAAASCMGSKD